MILPGLLAQTSSLNTRPLCSTLYSISSFQWRYQRHLKFNKFNKVLINFKHYIPKFYPLLVVSSNIEWCKPEIQELSLPPILNLFPSSSDLTLTIYFKFIQSISNTNTLQRYFPGTNYHHLSSVLV